MLTLFCKKNSVQKMLNVFFLFIYLKSEGKKRKKAQRRNIEIQWKKTQRSKEEENQKEVSKTGLA